MNRSWYYAALAVLLLAILLHLALLFIVGVLFLLSLATIDIWAHFSLRNLHFRRSLNEQRVLFGEQVTFSLTVENAKILPVPWLEVEETVPPTLRLSSRQGGQRSVNRLEALFSLRWYERVTRRYTLRCTMRGIHAFGPTLLRGGDLFGFLICETTSKEPTYLLVYPLVVPLTRFGLPARRPFGERRAPQRLIEDPSRLVGVREYREGDSLRRINWKASARSQSLQSHLYESSTSYTLAVFVNTQTWNDGIYSPDLNLFELLVCVAASVASWSIDQGYATGLYVNTTLYQPEQASDRSLFNPAAEGSNGWERHQVRLKPAIGEEQRRRMLELLARIQPFFGSSLQDLIQAERFSLPAGSTVVLVTSTLGEQLLETLRRVRQSGHSVSILLVGDAVAPDRLAGLSVYHLGGEETWRQLMEVYTEAEEITELVGDQRTRGFQL